jgi:aryl-alcohol dehydrogenase-like predicted oxidoreductase
MLLLNLFVSLVDSLDELPGKLESKDRLDSTSFLTPCFVLMQVGQIVAQYVDLAKEMNVKPAQLALAWVKSRWFVGSTIIGATKTTYLKENIEAFDLEISEEILKKIDFIHLQCKDPFIFV